MSALRFFLPIALLFVAFAAEAKDVYIEWKPVPKADGYELEVYREGKLVERSRETDSRWKADLQAGSYLYRLRALDKLKRPGLWSEARALIVMPAAPKAIGPLDGDSVEFFGDQGAVLLKWNAVEGVAKYRIEVSRDKQVVLRQIVAGTSLELRGARLAKYTWSVSSIVESGARAPASLAGKVWESEIQEVGEFSVVQKILAKPDPIAPLGRILPPPGGRLALSWKPVSGAESYEVKIYGKGGHPQQARAYVTPSTSFAVKIPDEGHFVWEVRALAGLRKPAANDPASPEIAASGPKAISQFTVDPTAKFTDPKGYVALSTMFAPYTYRIVSPATLVEGTYAASSITLRLSGEYFVSSKLGIAAAAETSSMSVGSQSASRMGAEIIAKYRLSLSDGRYGWVLIPKLGFELREYPEFRPINSKDQAFELHKPQSIGAQVGFDLRKQFSESFSLGAKLSFFKPLTLSGAQGSLGGGANMRNLSLGLQGLYWLNSNWGLAAGGFFDMRSISYAASTPASAATSATGGAGSSQEIYMDGLYFFGSLIYSFGK